ncbi:hypothetical protein PV767_09435 [Stenotrophomonas rhizophila]|uniref:hypothetical protein n=1 Tax=Stenotrophomonas TaxID=40323 RepID=UPI003B79FB7E
MNDIEKRARELLAAELRNDFGRESARYVLDGNDDGSTAMRAIIAALTPPDGYVLVPVELTHEMYCAFVEQWFTKVRAIDDTEMEDCYAALLAARPEVSGG